MNTFRLTDLPAKRLEDHTFSLRDAYNRKGTRGVPKIAFFIKILRKSAEKRKILTGFSEKKYLCFQGQKPILLLRGRVSCI